MKIKVYLPDGSDFEVIGAWKGLLPAGGRSLPVIRVQKAFRVPGGPFAQVGRAFVPNIFAVLKDVATDEVLYNPRALERGGVLLPNEQEWLDEHPAWPGELV